jgi:two-component system, NtrC family, response regulator AtoC
MGTDFPNTSQVEGNTLAFDSANSWFVQGGSPSIKALERVIRELADSDLPVLLLAEAGAGKRATAERIHQLSARRDSRFEVVNCGALSPEALLPSGTGGDLFESGTVFLEEVAELNPACQEQLLERISKFEKNGVLGARTARLICGTARDLEFEVKSARFREDLYYRISGVSLRLPPLRQRKEDIPQLLKFFLSKCAADYRRPTPVLSAETQQFFADYAWPGNLRELEDAARAIVVLGDETLAMGGLRSLLAKSDRGNGERVSLKQAAKAASREAEKELILKVLNRTRWNRRRAAQELQISYKALLYKLKQIGYGEYGAS